MTNVIRLPKPRSYTSAESVIEEVRLQIFETHTAHKEIAKRCAVSATTIHNLANGKTRWPRPTTLFPLLNALNLEMRLVPKKPS